MEASDAGLRSETDTDRGILAHFTDRPPKGKELFSRNKNASLFEEVLREPRPAQYCRNKDARFFQSQSKTACYAKVFDHCSTQPSKELCFTGRLRGRQKTGKHCRDDAAVDQQVGSCDEACIRSEEIVCSNGDLVGRSHPFGGRGLDHGAIHITDRGIQLMLCERSRDYSGADGVHASAPLAPTDARRLNAQVVRAFREDVRNHRVWNRFSTEEG